MVFNSLFGFKESGSAVSQRGRENAPSEPPETTDDGLGTSIQQQQQHGPKNFDDPIGQAESRILSSISDATRNNAEEGNLAEREHRSESLAVYQSTRSAPAFFVMR